MTTANLLTYCLLLLIFVAANGVFVAFEFALISMRRTRVTELIDDGVLAARAIRRLQNDMDETISGAQVGITFASLVLGWIGEPAVHEILHRAFGLVPAGLIATIEQFCTSAANFLPEALVSTLQQLPILNGLSFLLSFSLLSLLHVVLGEQVPKGLALRFPERLLLIAAGPFLLYRTMVFPLIFVFSFATKSVLRLMGIKQSANHEPVHSSEELSHLIDGSSVAGEISHAINNVLQKALDLQDLQVSEVMRPLDEVDMVEVNTSLRQLLKVVADCKHSRLPVYKDRRDNIIGVFSTKDLFEIIDDKMSSVALEAALKQLSVDFHLSKHLRPYLRVTDGMQASSLLHMLLIRTMPMAIVINDTEERLCVGISTLEDVLEHLVGEIKDEHDH
ncbi:MAG: HlyC/CorC family transporter [Candidatus Obscuribacter sp.]|nr:HlyC/CorC family transporter [Candidatus Obscuribacter sp.]MBL8085992.1 HlyC/CorC family transporter [Candidatus Obscuribacter sp.]